MESIEQEARNHLDLSTFARLYAEMLQLAELDIRNVPYCKEILSIITEADTHSSTPATDLNEYFNFLLDEKETDESEQEYIRSQKAHFKQNIQSFIKSNTTE